MYQTGEYVVYGVHGVCRVVGTEKQLVNRKRTEFLVLVPLTQGQSRFYVPMRNPAAMEKLRKLLSRQELEELLASESIREDCWIPEENLRKQRYRELIAGCDRRDLLQMLGTLYRQKDELLTTGKKMHQSDDGFLRDAEKLLCSEICMIMGLDKQDAIQYLHRHLT